jgi:predicted nucleic acid-binding protein
MLPAFWDSSSLVPLCVKQASSQTVYPLASRYELIVWWSAPVEVRGAFARLLRMGHITSSEYTAAQVDLNQLRHSWREIQPSLPLRDDAESFVDRFHLNAADAQQLAAANIWGGGRPSGRAFLSGDAQLLAAARQLGFHIVHT